MARKHTNRVDSSAAQRNQKSVKERATTIVEGILRSAKKLRDLKKGMKAADYQAVQEAATFADELSKSKKLFAAFISDNFWFGVKKRPRIGDRADALRFVIRMLRNNDNKSSSMRYLAVQKLLSKRVPLANLSAELIRRGGYRKILGWVSANSGTTMLRTPSQPIKAMSKDQIAVPGRPNGKITTKNLTALAARFVGKNGVGLPLLFPAHLKLTDVSRDTVFRAELIWRSHKKQPYLVLHKIL